MSDNLVHSHSDGDDSVHPYQSVWMSHWKRTSCKSADQACTRVITNHDFKKDGHDSKRCLLVDDPELGINVSEYARGSQQVAESRAANCKNWSPFTMSSSNKIKNECLDYLPLQGIAVVNGKSEGISPSLLPLVPENGSSLMEFGSALKALRKYPEKQGRSIDLLDNGLTVSTFFQNDFKGSASKYLPFHFLSKGFPLDSPGKDQSDQSIAILSSEEHLNKTNHNSFSALFLRKKTKNLLDPLANSFSTHKKKAFLLHDPSTSENQKPDLQCDDVQKHSNSIHDVETMRICSTIDSLEESSRGAPKISKTTHHFLITKKTDVNLSEEAQMLRDSTITTKLKGNHLSDLFDETTDSSILNQKKANFHPSLESSADIVKDIGTSAVCPTEDSSVDTDSMDLIPFQENHFTGLSSLPSNKDLELDPKTQSPDASDLAGEFGGHLNSEQPDINNELPDFPVQKNGANVKETSTSSTRSLDLLKNSKSTPSPNDSFGQELNSRWVRRLKCSSSSDYANGNRNSQNEEATIGEKIIRSNKIIKCSSSKPSSIGKSCAKKQKIYDERKNRETLLSHPWIQRWCSHGAAISDKKLEPMVVCEAAECSRMALNEYKGKQFPSMAAMAMMGKAMNGFRPCELRKKGSYLVWNTEDL